MHRRKITFRHRNTSVKLQFSWPASKSFYVDDFLLIVNNPCSKMSYYQFLNVGLRYCTYELPFNTSSNQTPSNIGELAIYGLKRFADTVNGGCFFVIKTFGKTTMEPESTHKEIALKLVTSTQSDFPKFREEVSPKKMSLHENFEVDNIFHPPSNYSLTNLSSKIPVRGSCVILFEEKICRRKPEFKKMFVFIHYGGDIFHIPFPLEAATDYMVRVKRGIITRNGGFLIAASAHASFQTYMTQIELDELLQKAVNFIAQEDTGVACLTHFYRTKPTRYFNAIRTSGGVMRKYIKNLGGDSASSLNRNIQGLFFSAHLHPSTLIPPPYSPYGDQRLHIPVFLMMRQDTNLYFADFYCHSVLHRVTLVLTHRNTESDFFCKQRLIQLDMRWNPFLTLSPSGAFAYVTMALKVEVFYTEDVNIGRLIWDFPSSVYFTRVKMRKESDLKKAAIITSIGFSKKEGCIVCNLSKRLKSVK